MIKQTMIFEVDGFIKEIEMREAGHDSRRKPISCDEYDNIIDQIECDIRKETRYGGN